ncbi:hypothetical protein WN944_022091 [Citrus x changshan-huyou]|uniref:Uncharacterized protein n=1 Tax=Citrus x changshan-huyou TaxID=2935761 RepID=A0AAP0N3W6_9ROSI
MSTFGNNEHIRKPRKDPRRKPRIDEHIRKRLEDKVSLKIHPVNKWNKFTAIKIQEGCPGGTGTDLGFRVICQDNNRNHLDERVYLLIKIACISDLLVTAMARIRKHYRKRAEKRAKGRAHSKNKETTSTFGNQEKILEENQESTSTFGKEWRSMLRGPIDVLRKLEDNVSLKIRPVNKWNKFTAIKIQGGCLGGGTGTDLGFHIIFQDNNWNHLDERVHLLIKSLATVAGISVKCRPSYRAPPTFSYRTSHDLSDKVGVALQVAAVTRQRYVKPRLMTIACVSDLLVTAMVRIRKHDRKRAEKRAKGRAHSENKETTSTFGNDEHIRKPRKDPRRKPRIDEHIRKRVEKPDKGPDRHTQYDLCHCNFLIISNQYSHEETSIPMNCRTKIGKIGCSEFEPIGGVDMLEFMDEFSVHSTCGESVGLMIRLGQRVDVVVNGPHGHIALGEIIGINVDYERQSC